MSTSPLCRLRILDRKKLAKGSSINMFSNRACNVTTAVTSSVIVQMVCFQLTLYIKESYDNNYKTLKVMTAKILIFTICYKIKVYIHPVVSSKNHWPIFIHGELIT